MPGMLYVVSTPIGNVDDVTFRAVRVLREVAVIAAEDPQQTRALLERHEVAAPVTSYHNLNKEEKTPILLARLSEGDDVALVSDAGTPVIADPGRWLIAEAVAAGIRVTAVPGPCALLAAIMVAGLPADGFLFDGMLPKASAALRRTLLALRSEPRTLVFYDQPGRLRGTLAAIQSVLGNRYVVVAQDLTTPKEACLRGLAGDVLKQSASLAVRTAVTLVVEGNPAGKNGKDKKSAVKRRRVSGS
jgi:16S rRNA (cytidine1402-2'-O)-methyltransferase